MSKKLKRSSGRSAISKSLEENEIEFSLNINIKKKLKFNSERCDENKADEIFTSSDYSSDADDDDEPDVVTAMNDDAIRHDWHIVSITWLIIPIVIIVIAVGYWACLPSAGSINIAGQAISTYNDGFAQMKSNFRNLNPISWKILNISLYKQMFRLQPIEKPAVIILIGTKQRVEQFHSELVRLVLHRCPPYHIKEAVRNPDDLKSDLMEFLERNLANHCAYFAGIDTIPAGLGPLLQGLTDELNAKHKQMIYLFSMDTTDGTRERDSPLAEKEAEIFVVDRLRSVWADEMGEERFIALQTRLVVNVISVF